ncbi:hypothetical protein [Pseudaeromonas paramecii]|uniref:hypothetical protein n=1 Tax=Pseudaeromonas paramecii TaxID=2138166 RepID=UPI0031E610A2
MTDFRPPCMHDEQQNPLSPITSARKKLTRRPKPKQKGRADNSSSSTQAPLAPPGSRSKRMFLLEILQMMLMRPWRYSLALLVTTGGIGLITFLWFAYMPPEGFSRVLMLISAVKSTLAIG